MPELIQQNISINQPPVTQQSLFTGDIVADLYRASNNSDSLELFYITLLQSHDIPNIIKVAIFLKNVNDSFRYKKHSYFNLLINSIATDISNLTIDEFNILSNSRILNEVIYCADDDDIGRLSVDEKKYKYIAPHLTEYKLGICFKYWEANRIAKFLFDRYYSDSLEFGFDKFKTIIRNLDDDKILKIQKDLFFLNHTSGYDQFSNFIFSILPSKQIIIFIFSNLKISQIYDFVSNNRHIIFKYITFDDIMPVILKDINSKYFMYIIDILLTLPGFQHYLEEKNYTQVLFLIINMLLEASEFEFNISASVDIKSLCDFVIKSNNSKLIYSLCKMIISKNWILPDKLDFDKLQELFIKVVKDADEINSFIDYCVRNGKKISNINLAMLRKKYNVLELNRLKKDGDENNEIEIEEIRKNRKILHDKLDNLSFNEANRDGSKIKGKKRFLKAALEINEFEEKLSLSKDFFFIDYVLKDHRQIEDCKILWVYLKIKNKKLFDLYLEVFKNDVSLFLNILHINNIILEYDEYTKLPLDILERLAKASTNFGEYVKFLKKLTSALQLMHEIYIEPYFVILSILNKQFDIDNKNNQEFLEVVSELYKYQFDFLNKIIEINNEFRRINPNITEDIIDIDNFKKNYVIYKQLYNRFRNGQNISFQRGSKEYIAVKQLHTIVNTKINAQAIIKVLPIAKPKDKSLFILDMTLQNGINFRVLKFLDPYTLQVGADTECCQRIGGAGENAAIDSFINPLAGVLVCEYNGMIISQSYFHFIPRSFGFILDNVEWNENNAKKLGIDTKKLSKIYSVYVKLLKEKNPNIKYVRCGMSWNKLDNSLFSNVEMEHDPRHFEYTEQYSDFDFKNHIDLTKPSAELDDISIDIKEALVINKNKIMKISQIRCAWLNVISSLQSTIRFEKIATIFEYKIKKFEFKS